MAESHPTGPVRITTDAFPERSRLELWREIYGRNIVNVDIKPLDDGPFHASVAFHALPGLGVAVGSRSDASYIVQKRGAAKAQDQVLLTLPTRGHAHMEQLGREYSGRPGSAILVSGAEPGAATLRGDGAFITLAFPRAALQGLMPDLGAALMRPIPEGNQALRLLINYLGLLNSFDGALDSALARAFSTHVLDLTALALGAGGEAREIARARGAKAAWRRAIVAEIDAGAQAPDASAAAIARKLGISERYLRAILEETGATFSELLLERRLALAWRRLNDPRARHQKIVEIALSAGFSDLSYFNRSFRGRFGETPTSARAGACGDPPPARRGTSV
ncbi:MAG TPA: helix-turn-helix domain-containing protein [Stellaceae bacterium]|nr:helix-turn-helix domain-containing protein [Stellaceae bacterium]